MDAHMDAQMDSGKESTDSSDGDSTDSDITDTTSSDSEADSEVDEAICGDGIEQEGEQCDDGDSDETNGCTSLCEYSCSDDSDCSDENICNGKEICDSSTHTCQSSANIDDGIVCGECPARTDDAFTIIAATGFKRELKNAMTVIEIPIMAAPTSALTPV